MSKAESRDTEPVVSGTIDYSEMDAEQLRQLKALRDRRVKERREDFELIAIRELLKGEEQHGEGRCSYLMTDDGPVVIKRPHPMTYKKMRDAGDWTEDALFNFVKPIALFPTGEALADLLLEKQPGALLRVVQLGAELAGKERDDLGKA
jgi:hypothetical protein